MMWVELTQEMESLTKGESLTSGSTGGVARHSLAVLSIPYVIKNGSVGCGMQALQVELSAFRSETTAPVAFS